MSKLIRSVILFTFFLVFRINAETTIKVVGNLYCCSQNKEANLSPDLIIDENEDCYELHRTLVELWETDTFSTDDKLNSIFTHKNDSTFVLYGSEELDPVVVFYLKSYHTCQVSVDDVNRGCFRTATHDIPAQYNDGNYEFTWHVGGSDSLTCP
uniref:Secreted protein n=1 Tax=Acrobeloides nanus TaxID=290746 RepID=A0A914EM80_9BILA